MNIKKSGFLGVKDKQPWEYFEKRIRSAAELKRLLPVRPAEQKELEAALGKPGHESNRCVYVHIPFCTKSCTFCGYYKCVNPAEEIVQKYVDALKTQVVQLAKTEWVRSHLFDALYFGGGTPTALPVSLFFNLLETIHKNFPLAANCEITLESTIVDLDDAFLKRLPGSMINRVSLGVQSFKEGIRKKYNRQANREEIQQKADEIRNAGITNICADLMYNLDEQTPENWQEDLNWIEKTGFAGCSVYPLLPFPNAPLVKNNNYKVPDPKNEYKLFKMADDFFTSLTDWRAITPVQYGHKIYGPAKYIALQADDADILALGPGAGGKINGLQYLNAFTIDNFLTDNSFPAGQTKIFRWQAEKNELIHKLRFFRKTIMPEDEFKQLFRNESVFINHLFEHEFIINNSGTFKLTQPGKYWAANIARLLLKSYF